MTRSRIRHSNILLESSAYLGTIMVVIPMIATVSGLWNWRAMAEDVTGTPAIFTVLGFKVGKAASPLYLLLAGLLLWAGLASITHENAAAFGNNSSLLVGLAISVPGIRMLKLGLRFHHESITEGELRRENVTLCWIELGSLAVATAIAMIWAVSDVFEAPSRFTFEVSRSSIVAICFLLCACTASLILATRKRPDGTPVRMRIMSASQAVFLAALAFWPWLAFSNQWEMPDGVNQWLHLAIALYMASILGWITMNSLLTNGLTLHGVRERELYNVLPITGASLVAFSFNLWLFGVVYRQSNLSKSSLLAIVGLTIASFVVVLVQVGLTSWLISDRAIAMSLRTRRFMQAHPVQNQAQDLLLYTLLAIISYLVFRILSAAVMDIPKAIEELSLVIGLGVPLALAHGYRQTIKNNENHLVQQDELWSRDPEASKTTFVEDLGVWIGKQSRYGLWLCPTIPLLTMWDNSVINDESQSFNHVQHEVDNQMVVRQLHHPLNKTGCDSEP